MGPQELLYAGNDPARSRRDAAAMWRHIQSVRALMNREGVMAVERLLSATAEVDGRRCRLTAFVDAYRRDIPMPTLNAEQWAGLRCHPEPAVNALTAQVLPTAGAIWADLQAE